MPSPAPAALPAAPPDAAERTRALDPARSFIVRAPAGSGKTELLIQRFLALLATVDEPEQIEALTFTRKAAGEMRERLLHALAAADAPAPATAHHRQTWELATAARARDAAREWRLLQNPQRLRLGTLDGLCRRLVGRMPWLSRQGMMPEPAEDAKPLYREAALAVCGRVEVAGAQGDAVRRLVAHLNADVGAAANLLAALLDRRGDWLGMAQRAADDAAGLRAELEATTNALVAGHLAVVCAEVEASGCGAEILAIAQSAGAELHGDPGQEKNPIRACHGLTQLPSADPATLPLWHGISHLLLVQVSPQQRKSLNINQGIPPTDKASKQRYKNVALRASLVQALYDVRGLPDPQFEPAQWEIVLAAFTALRLAAAELQLVFARAGQVDFTAVTLAAIHALGDGHAPTQLAFNLDARLRHLLVDEFQDTSHDQLRLLHSLTADWQPGDGRTAFLVGDPMQSIFSFRKAEVGLFVSAWQGGLAPHVPLEPLTLSANFRSLAPLVHWNNRSFAACFPPTADATLGAVTHEPSLAVRGDAPVDSVAFHVTTSAAAEADAIATLAATALAAGQSTAILLIKHSLAAPIIAALQRGNVPWQAVKMHSLAAHPAVGDLMALTRALYHPGDRVAWLAVLRAPWCGLTLADLEQLCANPHTLPGLAAGNDLARCAALSSDGQLRLARLMSILNPALAQRGRTAVRDLVSWSWRALGGAASTAADAFFDLLDPLTAADPGELDRLQARLHDLFEPPAPAATGTVQLLTMHLAKGLEFDCVLLPSLDSVQRRDSDALLLALDEPFLLAAKRATGADRDRLYQFIAARRHARKCNEYLRLAYVAATRARQQMHLFARRLALDAAGAVKPPAKGTMLHLLWPGVGAAVTTAALATLPGAAAPVPGMTAAIVPAEPPPQLRRVRLTDLPAVPHAAVVNSAGGLAGGEAAGEVPPTPWPFAGDLQRQVGLAVHAQLQALAASGQFEWTPERLRQLLAAAGVAAAALPEATARARAALERTVADPRGQWILAPHSAARNEWRLTGMQSGRVQHTTLDRTFVDQGVRWIIDYKTAAHEGAGLEVFLDAQQAQYRPQLENYARLCAALDPATPIRCGLYFPLLGGWREWSPAPL